MGDLYKFGEMIIQKWNSRKYIDPQLYCCKASHLLEKPTEIDLTSRKFILDEH